MKRNAAVMLIAVTALAVSPTALYAEDDEGKTFYNEIEFGAAYLSDDSYKLGEWTGLDDQGFYAIGSFRIGERPAWDGDSRQYWKITGDDLGLDARSLSGTYGEQGRYKLKLEYDKLPHLRFDDGRTPFLGAGTNSLTLPSGWVGNRSTQGMTQLEGSLQGINIKTERERVTGSVSWIPAKNWTTSAKFRHETKDGVDAVFAAFGTNGGNPSAVQIPEVIDYETNELELGVGYADRKAQLQVGYQLSLFDNANRGTAFENPFSTQFSGGPWAAGSGFPTGRGEVAGAPDNMSQSLSVAGGYNVNDVSRLTANLSYVHMTQDAAFLPYSANPLLTVNQPLPRSSLDGEINRFIFDLGGSTRPMQGLDLRASYRFQDLDNSTPRDVYVRIAGDAENQAVGLANDSARINDPYSFKQHLARLDGSYRVNPMAKLSFGYEFDQRDRDTVDVSKTREHTLHGKIAMSPLDYVNGWLKYSHSWRDGSAYRGNAAFQATHTPEFLATLTPGVNDFENDPRLRRFWLADRDRDVVKGRLNFQVSEDVALGFDASYTDDDYDSSPLGLQEATRANASVDLSWVPREDIRLNAFTTYDRYRQEQYGCSWGGGNQQCVLTPPAPERSWSTEVRDNVFTVGFGGDWTVLKNKLDMGADYNYSKSITEIKSAAGTAIGPSVGFPQDLRTSTHSLGVHADYHVKDNLSLRVGYRYQQLTTRDWATQDIGPDTIGRVLSLGTQSPKYTAHSVGVAVKYRF